jgi:hypothetical protein
MRRTGPIILAVAAAALVATAGPAAAHPEMRPSQGHVGAATTFALLIDGSSPTAVAITPPPTFRLDDVTAPTAWARTVDDGTYRFTTAAPVPTPSFQVRGTPTAKGVLVFAVTTTTAAGETIRHDAPCTDAAAPYKGALLFVDVDLATACDLPLRSRPVAVTVGIGLVAAAVVLGAAYPVVKRSRERSASR